MTIKYLLKPKMIPTWQTISEDLPVSLVTWLFAACWDTYDLKKGDEIVYLPGLPDGVTANSDVDYISGVARGATCTKLAATGNNNLEAWCNERVDLAIFCY
uniref:Uncharacterized protein n=1 Tax=Glossina palpalis gambiensis TaxID=67801 RepID=A0A1B0BTH1_9MUSC